MAKAVARIRELESKSFREAWEEAQAHQRSISQNEPRTLVYGAINATVCTALALAFFAWNELNDDFSPSTMLLLLPIFALPILLMRFPLFRAFVWGSAKVVGRVFGAELAALGRAGEGTVLGRLLAGVGKK